ncbi:MAG: phosphate signaling complex protein PhoU [Proteobacteria bacterium]|nr:phosphate signaling complex protein PhoU [Pseudomonadota bacterium]MCL2308241.1 phosphate signaling complex protein PhoU [Pseudomonadota bacterium]
MTTHMSKQFEIEMETIRSDVLAMGGLVEAQLARSVSALSEDENPELLEIVKRNEKEINQMQVDIDLQCAQIIARRQPAAVDLRIILTISKVVNDLERVGDEAKKIARKAAGLQGNERLTRMQYYETIHAGELAQSVLHRALNAFARLDVDEAIAIYDADDEIDMAFDLVTRQLVGFMMEDPRTISSALEVLFVAKSIERIGDHAKNIAEAIVQVVMGKDVRHVSLEEIKAKVAERE